MIISAQSNHSHRIKYSNSLIPCETRILLFSILRFRNKYSSKAPEKSLQAWIANVVRTLTLNLISRFAFEALSVLVNKLQIRQDGHRIFSVAPRKSGNISPQLPISLLISEARSLYDSCELIEAPRLHTIKSKTMSRFYTMLSFERC